MISAAMEQAGGLSVSDKLYLLTSALLDEKSVGARPGKDTIELAEIDFIMDTACAGLVGPVGSAWDGDGVGGTTGPVWGGVDTVCPDPDWGGEAATEGRNWDGEAGAGTAGHDWGGEGGTAGRDWDGVAGVVVPDPPFSGVRAI